jgi:hypothetical protein
VDYAKNNGLSHVYIELIDATVPKRIPNLQAVVDYARSKGLGVGAWIWHPMSMTVVTGVREIFDWITTNNPEATLRAAISGNPSLFVFDSRNAASKTATTVPAIKNGASSSVAVNGTNQAVLTSTTTTAQPFYGIKADYLPSAGRWTSVGFLKNDPGGGYLVNASVKINSFPAAGREAHIVSNTDGGGFGLILGTTSAGVKEIRFLVHNGAGYQAVSYNATNLDLTQSHYITASYNGRTAPVLFIDLAQVATGAAITGGVKTSTAPVALGTNPTPTGSGGSFFDGTIRSVNLTKWN